jgi:hypothetical protein
MDVTGNIIVPIVPLMSTIVALRITHCISRQIKELAFCKLMFADPKIITFRRKTSVSNLCSGFGSHLATSVQDDQRENRFSFIFLFQRDRLEPELKPCCFVL